MIVLKICKLFICCSTGFIHLCSCCENVDTTPFLLATGRHQINSNKLRHSSRVINLELLTLRNRPGLRQPSSEDKKLVPIAESLGFFFHSDMSRYIVSQDQQFNLKTMERVPTTGDLVIVEPRVADELVLSPVK